MHAYGHQWSCQLVYNPRLQKGLGLTDGEGVERTWSRLRKSICITRSCGVCGFITPFNISVMKALEIKKNLDN
jgi:Kyakuja-Dileera-Zisupton transposase